MNILIPHSWLTDFLETDAKPEKIAEHLSACGPSVEKLEKVGDDWVYDVEVTTNRVDMMSVYGVAREAAVILPQFGYKAYLKKYNHGEISKAWPFGLNKFVSGEINKFVSGEINKFVSGEIKEVGKLDIKIVNNPALCKRILAIKLENVKLGPSPTWLSTRLSKVGQRPLNNTVDITNYVMWEVGHPIHVFDYDRITNKKIIVRVAKKGETLTTLDGIKYSLSGGEVVFDDGKGEIIDLPGIMGTANSVVTPKTKNVLLWIESIDPVRIRQASMGLAIRSQAAILNEKQVDPELGLPAFLRAVDLFRKVTEAKVGSQLVDIYPSPYVSKKIKTTLGFIDNRLGVNIAKNQIKKILSDLEFDVSWGGSNLEIKVPSFRAHDITIPEDIVEEIARIYGYHKLPSKLPEGALPEKIPDAPFDFEIKLKNVLKGWGAIELFTYSMVTKEYVQKPALKLINPLGKDSEYMRKSLMPSLVSAAKQNSGEAASFHLFEMANIYLPRKGSLPEEKMMMAGIFANYEFREAKGIIESLLTQLNIEASFVQEDYKDFLPNQRVKIEADGRLLGQFGVLEKNQYLYYEFGVELLRTTSSPFSTFKPIPKYPAQIEDITLVLPQRTRVGELIQSIKSISRLIQDIELTDVYKDAYTFRLSYQHPRKTLTDKEVEEIRKKTLEEVRKKYGAMIKT